MKKIINKTIIITILIMSLIMVGCNSNNITNKNPIVINGVEKEVIKVGFIGPISGDYAFLGEATKNAILMAKDEYKDTKFEYEIVFEDSKFDPKLASIAAQKLINVDEVDVIISYSSAIGNAISPIAQENEVVHLGIATDKNIAKGNYNFIHWTQPEQEVELLIEELINKGYRDVALIVSNDPSPVLIAQEFKEKAKSKNINIVYDEIFNLGISDFKTSILKSKEAKPQIYVLDIFSPDLEIYVKQLKEQNVNVPITGIEGFETSQNPELFEGMWYVSGSVANDEFNIKYKNKFNENPQFGTANGYDLMNIVINTYESSYKNNVKPDKSTIAYKINNLKDFESVLGILDVEDGIIRSPATLKKIVNGEPIVID